MKKKLFIVITTYGRWQPTWRHSRLRKAPGWFGGHDGWMLHRKTKELNLPARARPETVFTTNASSS